MRLTLADHTRSPTNDDLCIDLVLPTVLSFLPCVNRVNSYKTTAAINLWGHNLSQFFQLLVDFSETKLDIF